MSRLRKAFRTLKVKLTEFPKAEQAKFEQLYIDLEAAKSDAVAAERAAQIAAAQAQATRAKAAIAELHILVEAASHDKRIENERNWTVFKDGDNTIIFEGITERILRNATRASLQQMGKQVEDDDINLNMFEDGEEPGEDAQS